MLKLIKIIITIWAGCVFAQLFLATPLYSNKPPIYMAGIKSGDICHCPVTAGDCVCAIHW